MVNEQPQARAESAQVWRQIQSGGAEMDRLSPHWTDEKNKLDWSAAKPLLDELRGAQEKAEAIAHTLDEQPAAKILATEAAPLARVILEKASAIIDHESTIASTDQRKSLLIGFADTRGGMAMAIAAAVEEQSSATQEIARNVQQAAVGTTEIATNVTGVQQAAGDAGAAAHQVLGASTELSRQAETLPERVETFLNGIKAA